MGANQAPNLQRPELKPVEDFNFVEKPLEHTNGPLWLPTGESRTVDMEKISMVSPEEAEKYLGFAAPVPLVLQWQDEVTGETRKVWGVDISRVGVNDAGEHLVPVTEDSSTNSQHKMVSAGRGVEGLIVEPEVYLKTGGHKGYLSLRSGEGVHFGPWTKGDYQWFRDSKYLKRFPDEAAAQAPLVPMVPAQGALRLPSSERKHLDVTIRLEDNSGAHTLVLKNNGSGTVATVFSATVEKAYDPLPPSEEQEEALQEPDVVQAVVPSDEGEAGHAVEESGQPRELAPTEQTGVPVSQGSGETNSAPTDDGSRESTSTDTVTVPVLSADAAGAPAPDQVATESAASTSLDNEQAAGATGNPEIALQQFGQHVEAAGTDEAIADIPSLVRAQNVPLSGILEIITNRGGAGKLLARLDELGREGLEPEEVVGALPVRVLEMLHEPQEMMQVLPAWSPRVAVKARTALRNYGIDFLFPDESSYNRYLVKIQGDPDMWQDEQGNRVSRYR